jgi:Flp pilus assembly protein TadD
MVYSDQGRLAEAQQLLRQATEIAPDHAHSWIALGVACLRAKDAQAARPALERALALEPRNPYALRTFGSLQAMTGDTAGAIGSLTQARELAPDDPIVLLTLAQALLGQDPVAHAAAADGLLTRVLELDPPAPSPSRPRTPDGRWPARPSGVTRPAHCGMMPSSTV